MLPRAIKGAGNVALTIGQFLGGVAGGIGSSVARGITGAAIDTAVGAGKLVTSPFRSEGKMVDQSKLRTEQQLQEKKEEQVEKSSKKVRSEKTKADSKQRKEKLDPKDKEVKFKGTSLSPDRSKAKKDAAVEPAVKVLLTMSKTLNVIQTNVSTILEGLKAGEKDDQRLKGKQKEKAIEEARFQKQDKAESSSEPGLLKKGINKIAEKGVGGIFKMILGGLVKFFAGKFIIETFFPQFKKPIFGFFSEIGDFFLNIRDALAALQNKDFKLAKEELKAAGGNFKTVFQTLAKFLSNLVDSVLRFMGFDEFKMYDKAAEKVEELRPKFNKYIENLEKYFDNIAGPNATFGEKLLASLKDVFKKIMDKIGDLFSMGNIMSLAARAASFQFEQKFIQEESRENIEALKADAYRRTQDEVVQQAKDAGVFQELKDFYKRRTGETFVSDQDVADFLMDLPLEDPELGKIAKRFKDEGKGHLIDTINKASPAINQIREKLEQDIEEQKKRRERRLEDLIKVRFKENRLFGSTPESDQIKNQVTGEKLSKLDKSTEFDGSALNAGSVIIASYDRSSSSINVDNSKRDNYRQTVSSVSVHNGGDGIGRFRPSDPFSEIV